jgi:hypothetical protein
MQDSLSDLAKMKNDLIARCYENNKWGLHLDLKVQLSRLIDPNPKDMYSGGHKLFTVTAPKGWTRAPLCLIKDGYKNLSMPKMDLCFALAMHQTRTDESSPLWEICGKFFPEEDKRAKVADLLSLNKMHLFNEYQEFADVSS